jgi:hypothetical protein
MKKSLLFVIVVVFSVLGFATAGLCTSLSDIQFSPASPSALPFGQSVTVNFSYNVSEAGGVRIFVLPFTNGTATPNYGVSGSPLYAVGTGSGSGTVTILSGETNVDNIRIRITNADQSTVLEEFFVPVVYHFFTSATSITNIRTSSPSPASLAFGQHVDITFDYATTVPGGVRIFQLPLTNGAATPNYGVSGSPLYTVGSSSGSGFATVLSGETTVDSIQFKITNNDQSSTLGQFVIPVNYRFPVAFAAVPAAPTIAVSVSGTTVTLSWNSVPTADGYWVGYAPYPGAEYINTINVGNKTSTTFKVIAGSVVYYVGVYAYNANGLSALSNIGTFTIH